LVEKDFLIRTKTAIICCHQTLFLDSKYTKIACGRG